MFTILDHLSSTKDRKVSGLPFHSPDRLLWGLPLIPVVGWKCCKPRVLTFDEFLDIPPCTTGKHSEVDDTPDPGPVQQPTAFEPKPPPPKPISITNGAPTPAPISRVPRALKPAAPATPPQPESESDDPSLAVPPATTCRRRGCNSVFAAEATSAGRDNEECIHHPGQALFHEGSKGWTCCKRRVLEFDEFLEIEGCRRKKKHLFVGSGKKAASEETLFHVRYYLNPRHIVLSLASQDIDSPE